MTTTLDLTRHVDVPRERAWQAWTDPERLMAWWWHTVPTTRIAADARVGGHYRFENPDFGVTGEYLEVVENERLVFTWRWIEDGIETAETDTVTVTFIEAEGGTDVSVHHPTDESNAEPYEIGWRDTLRGLDQGVA